MKIRAEDSLGYWLFYTQRTVAYAFSEVLRKSCLEHNKPYVVTPPQLGVLVVLNEMDDITIGTISQRRGVDAPTVTGIVRRLEQSGLVDRVHDREDRRVVKVRLTGEARDLMSFLLKEVEGFNTIMTRGLSKNMQRDLLAKLQRVIANVSVVGPDTGDRFGLLPKEFLDEWEANLSSELIDETNLHLEKEGTL